MLKKRFNPDRELKKVQKKGVYNPKTKLIGIFGVLILTVLIVSSYALWNYISDKNIAFNGKATKMLKITLNLTNGEFSDFASIILSDNTLQTETPNFNQGYPSYSITDTSKSGLYAADDYGGTSYYFRGAKDQLNNNVRFANKDWKIIRINGDGTIRLILNDKITYQGQTEFKFNDYEFSSGTAQHEMVGFTYGNNAGNECTNDHPCEVKYDGSSFSNADFGGKNSDIKDTLEGWYKENLNSVNDQIAYGLFCNDVSYGSGTDDGSVSELYYGAHKRLMKYPYSPPTLICPDPNNKSGTPRTYGGLYKTKIGLITIDELNMEGFSMSSSSSTNDQNYLYRSYQWSSMSPYSSDYNATVFGALYGNVSSLGGSSAKAIFPVINLNPDVKVMGKGTEEDPYIVGDSIKNIYKIELGKEAKIKIKPQEKYVFESTSCSNSQTGTYDSENNEFKITPTDDTVCTIKFKPTLAGIILANNDLQITEPDFTKSSPYCESENSCKNPTDNGSGLYTAEDGDGKSYYFRGAVTNNNVQFANLNWKILRINGDGTIRLILDDRITYRNQNLFMFNNYNYSSTTPVHEKVGFTNNNKVGKECTNANPCEVTYNGTSFLNTEFGGANSDIKTTLENWYNTSLKSFNNQIAYGLFCNDVSYGSGTDDGSTKRSLYYGTFERIHSMGGKFGHPSLKCSDPTDINEKLRTYGGVYKTKIGLPTADELNMAGFSYSVEYGGLVSYPSEQNYLRRDYWYWTSSAGASDADADNFIAFSQSSFSPFEHINSSYGSIVPVINLKASVDFSVNSSSTAGTSSNPYVIK